MREKMKWFAEGPACSFRLFVTVECINILITLALFTFGVVINTHQSDNAQAQRNDQISYIQASKAQCELDKKRGLAQKADQEYKLGKKREDLEQGKQDLKTIETVAVFNTPQIKALARATQQRNIDRLVKDIEAANKLIAAYKSPDCSKFVVSK